MEIIKKLDELKQALIDQYGGKYRKLPVDLDNTIEDIRAWILIKEEGKNERRL